MMDEERKMKDRFRKNLPQFVNKIDPIELLPYLRCLSMQNRVSAWACYSECNVLSSWSLHGRRQKFHSSARYYE